MRPNTSLGLIFSSSSGDEAQPLHDAGAEALDQGVGLGRQPLDDGAAGLGLDVDRQRAAAPVQHIELRLAAGQAEIGRLAPVDADHLGAHVGEQRGRERRRADARHLDDAKAGEWTHRGYLSWLLSVAIAPALRDLRAISHELPMLDVLGIRVSVSQCRCVCIRHTGVNDKRACVKRVPSQSPAGALARLAARSADSSRLARARRRRRQPPIAPAICPPSSSASCRSASASSAGSRR